ncbi:hypothetical protein PR048_015848, partial [Dryococelus australis]
MGVQEGDKIQLDGNLRDVVEGIAFSEGFSEYSLEVRRASGKGDNYLGVLLRVIITGRRGGHEEASMSLILKCMPENEETRAAMQVDDFFDNEVFMYSEVLVAFGRLLEDKGLPEEERLGSFAKLLGCNRSQGDTTIVLEDMSARGYRMGDRLAGLDAAHCSLVMKTLGQFHACSFALRDQRPELFRSLGSQLKETLFRSANPESDKAATNFQNSIDHVESILLKMFPSEFEYVIRFREFGPHYEDRMLDVVSGEAAEPYAVICHGDCWTNNILFKYSEDGDAPVAACLLDLQIARYSSPFTDIAYFLYCCTEGDVRREAYKSLLSDYYNSLSQFLQKLGSDPDKMFPYSAFKVSVTE